VYVDESGDRGWSPTSSPVFIVAALIVPDEIDAQLRAVRDQLCIDLHKPISTVLHWAENLKKHDQRKYVSRTLGFEDITLSYFVIDKASFGGAPRGLGHHERMYNYALRRLLERISWFARDHGREARVTFAHVKNFKYVTLRNYLHVLQGIPTQIHWPSLASLKIKGPNDYLLLQFADIAAGALSSAICPDPYGSVEVAYLSELAHRIYRRPPGPITTYGLHVMRTNQLLVNQPWWAQFPK